jgi:hypothetical protein
LHDRRRGQQGEEECDGDASNEGEHVTASLA